MTSLQSRTALIWKLRRDADDIEVMSDAENHNAQQAAKRMRQFADELATLGQQQASLTALIPQFIEQLDEWDLWDRNPTEAFERQAAQFYAETGLMAPGKSVPLAMSSVEYDVERQTRYKAWATERRTKRRQMMRALATELAMLVHSLPEVAEWPASADQAKVNAARRRPHCPVCGSEDGSLGTSNAYFICHPCGKEQYWTPDHQHPGDWSMAVEASPYGARSALLSRIRSLESQRAKVAPEAPEPEEAQNLALIALLRAFEPGVSSRIPPPDEVLAKLAALEKAYEEQVALYEEARDLCNLNFDKRMEAEAALRTYGQHRPECKSKKARTTRNHDGSNTTRWPYECDCGLVQHTCGWGPHGDEPCDACQKVP